MPVLSSPCIGVCCLNDATGLCEGCGRSLVEISRWADMSELERRKIMAALTLRMARQAGLGE